MVRLLNTLALAAATLATATLAAQSCGTGAGKCGSDNPCCSQYGECGVGAYCLGGCDPKFSFTLDSCAPAPVCRNINSTFENDDKIKSKTKYLGDSSETDWVMDGDAKIVDDGLALTMAPNTVGTVMASSIYVWYGKITAVLKTSRGAGVVTAFILLSDMKDEIDFEWIGVDLETTQTNYYWQGVPNYNNGGNISNSDTFDEWHTYEVDWTEDQITWSVDGQVGRTLKKADTLNKTTNAYNYPQTPARVQLSLWPGGLSSNSPGTIAWAGGEINWDSEDIKKYGYDYAIYKSVSVECYDPPSDAKKSGSADKSYIYNDAAGLESNVVMTGNNTILDNFLDTGTNMTAKAPSASGSSSPQATAATIPGLSGAGTGSDSSRGGSSSGTTSSSSGSSSSSDSFSQGSSTDASKSEAAMERHLKGSLMAVVVAVAAVMIL